MTKISIIYTCRNRPNLTELCLRRLLELFPEKYDKEIILAYDGGDLDYIKRLLSVYEFDHIIMNPERKKSRFELINRALDVSKGDYYMHLENDFYWSKPGSIESAIEGFNKVDGLDFVRFEILPFWRSQCERTVQLENDELCIVPKEVRFRFNFNPHLRKTKFPIGRFPNVPAGTQAEGWFADLYNEKDFIAGCLMGENFRHLGVYDEHGFYKTYYAERFTLVPNEKEIDPWEKFQEFCINPIYLDLFRMYLDRYGKHEVAVKIYENVNPIGLLKEYPQLLQEHNGRINVGTVTSQHDYKLKSELMEIQGDSMSLNIIDCRGYSDRMIYNDFNSFKEKNKDKWVLVFFIPVYKKRIIESKESMWSVSNTRMLPANSSPEPTDWRRIIQRWIN